MEFTEVIQNRYSCKAYRPEQISAEALAAILEAGRVAPTAKNAQEQRVYVIQSPEALAKIDKATPCRYGAPTVLAVAYDRKGIFTYPGQRYDSGAEDAAIVATHMMLAAKNAGVDSCWLNFFDPDLLHADLGLPGDEVIVMLLDLGYPAPEKGGPLPNHTASKPLEALVSYL